MDSDRKLGKVLFGIDEWVRERLDVEAAPDVDTLLVNVLPLKESYGEIGPFTSSYSLQCCGTFDIPRSFVMEMIESTLSSVSFMFDMSKNSIDIHPAIVDTAAMLRWTAPDWFNNDLYGEHMVTAIWLISCSIASSSEQGLHLSAEDAYKIASYVGEFINASRDQGSRVSILVIKSTDGVAISNNPKIARPQRHRLQDFIKKLDKEKPSNVLTNNFMLHHDRKAAISRHGDLVEHHNGDHLVAHFSAICLAFGHYSEASKWQTSIGSGSIRSSLALSYSMLFNTISDEDIVSHESTVSYRDAIDWAKHGFGPAERERYLHVGNPAEIKSAPKSWLDSWTTKK